MGCRGLALAHAALTAVLIVACDARSADRVSETPAAADLPRNVVIILADDMGWGEPSCYGNTDYATPGIDRMAAEGVRFTNFYAGAPVCLPTRFSLLTGRYPNRDGIDGNSGFFGNQRALTAMQSLLPAVLKPAGYATGLIGKWHLGLAPGMTPEHRSFDTFRGFRAGYLDYFTHENPRGQPDWWHDGRAVDEPGYATTLINGHALEFIEAHRAEPFFLLVSHAAPHFPFQAPDGRRAEIGDAHLADVYRDMILELDSGVGQVLDKLVELDLAQQTLVVFVSDNGPRTLGRTGPFSGSKNAVWEGGVRVPAIAWCPGRLEAGRVVDDVASTLDLMPTCVDLAGVTLAEDRASDGTSLVPLLFEHVPLPSRSLFWAYRNQYDNFSCAMREGRWKLVFAMGRPLLFDLEQDPAELHDVAGDHPERVAAMVEAFRVWDEDTEAGAFERILAR